MKFRKNVLLKNHTTFKIGGPAKYFFEAKTTQALIEALKVARKNKIPFFVLGEGSNLLVSDKGFPGLVVKLNAKRYKLFAETSSHLAPRFAGRNSANADKLYAEAGVSLAALVRETGKRGLAGLEWAGGLPGTLGGAVFGNAGAFGGETKDTIIWVEALDKNLRVRKFTKKQCEFRYRSSIFKKKWWIILSAAMLLKKGNKKTIQSIALSHIKQRKDRGPLEYPNAGSIFKNCPVSKAPKRVVKMFKEVIKLDPFPVIPTAAIISRVPGLTGTKIGGAQVSTKHPNFIINLGKARAKDVINLIKLVKQKVKKRFGVDIEEEMRYIE